MALARLRGLAFASILRKVPLPRNLCSNGVRGLADAKAPNLTISPEKVFFIATKSGQSDPDLIETPMLADYLEEALSQFPEDFEEPL